MSLQDVLLALSQQGLDLDIDTTINDELIQFQDVAAVCDFCRHLGNEQASLSAWQELADAGVSYVAVGKAIASQLRSTNGSASSCAAAFYANLLGAKNGPVSALFNPIAFTSFLQVLKRCIFGLSTNKDSATGKEAATKPARKSRKRQAAQVSDDEAVDGDDDDVDAPTQRATQKSGRAAQQAGGSDDGQSMLVNVASFVEAFGLADYEDMMHMLLDMCVEVIHVCPPPKSSVRGVAGPSAIVYRVLVSLMQDKHGPLAATSALVCQRLLPVLLCQPPPGGAAKKQTAQEGLQRRQAVVSFILDMYRQRPEVMQGPMHAVIRGLCVRPLDRADPRAAAVTAAQELMSALPGQDMRSLCLWLLRLSRAVKPLHRLMAVDLAAGLLTTLPQPWAPEAGYKSFMDGSHGRGEDITAPWSAVLLAVLVTRADDKVAAVRARAVAHLAEVMSHNLQLLTKNTNNNMDDDAAVPGGGTGAGFTATAEGYLLALCGIPVMSLTAMTVTVPGGEDAGGQPGAQQQQPVVTKQKKAKGNNRRATRKGRRAADEDSEDGDEDTIADADDGEGDDDVAAPVDQGQQKGQRAGNAGGDNLLAGLTYDTLEASLPSRIVVDVTHIMNLAHRRLHDDKAPVRKAALGLLEEGLMLRAALPQSAGGPPRQVDIQAVEAATADALVSVRKAALSGASRLVTEFPEEQGCCELWVRAALPLIRDSETSIQDSLLDQVQERLLAPLAAVPGNNALNATRAAARVRPLLGALSAAGRGAATCLGRAANNLAAKKLLQAKKVAAGLEAIIQDLQADLNKLQNNTANADEDNMEGDGGNAQNKAKQHAAATEGRLLRQQLQGAWAVLREISGVEPGASNWQFLRTCWAQLQAAGQLQGGGGGGGESAGQQGAALLWVISNSASRFPPADAAKLAKDLLQALLAFSLPPAAASAHISALHRLYGITTEADGSSGSHRHKADWSKQLMDGAHAVLSAALDKKAQRDEASLWRLCAALFVVGEVSLLGVKPAPGLVIKVQALTAATATMATATQQQAAAAAAAAMTGTQADMMASQIQFDAAAGAAWQDMLAAAEHQSSQGPLAGLQGVFATQQQQQGGGGMVRSIGSALVGMAWLCLGKLCLADEHLAKKAAPLFVQELSRSPSPVVRNNCLVALADMCIHFTALVDTYLPRMAALIRDPHELVRRQALALLANLLMKDYVKWRGALFHRFALALVDTSPAVRQLAEHLLGDTLATKAPLLVYNHFVECIFVLNGCQAGLHASRLARGDKAGEGGGDAGDALAAARDTTGMFHLKGNTADMRSKRDIVYHTLLWKMSPENKFSTQAKLVSEILSAVADGLLPLNESGVEEVLGDVLRLLPSKQLKVMTNKLVSSEEDVLLAAAGGDAQGATQAVTEAARAKGKLVSGMIKKHLVESVVPLLCELRGMLMEARHPLLGSLMSCMAALLKDYKNEVEDILQVDKQLAKEIMYDLKQAGKQPQQQPGKPTQQTTHVQDAAPAAGHTHAHTPSEDDGAADQQGGVPLEVMATPGRPPATPAAGNATTARKAAAGGGGGVPGTAAKSPAAALLRSRQTPGVGAHRMAAAAAAAAVATPGSLLRSAGGKSVMRGGHGGDALHGSDGAASLAGATPAPVSAVKAKKHRRVADAKRRGGKPTSAAAAVLNSDDDEEGQENAQGSGAVTLPPLQNTEQQPSRTWNVQLEDVPVAKEAHNEDGPHGRIRRAKRTTTTATSAATGNTDVVNEENEGPEDSDVKTAPSKTVAATAKSRGGASRLAKSSGTSNAADTAATGTRGGSRRALKHVN